MSDQQPTTEDIRHILREELRPLWKNVDRHHREIYGHNLALVSPTSGLRNGG